MFTHTYETRYGDFKDYETVKTGTVLDIVQDISTKEADFYGYSIQKLREMNVAWLMQGINVYFDAPVKVNCPIEVSTAVQSLKGAVSERGCILRQEGKIVAKTIANWFTFNTQKMRVCRIPTEMHECYTCHDFKDSFFEYKRPQILEIENSEYTVRVANKDIDTNKHLNNQKSADLLMDALPFDFNFNYLGILYKKATYLGDELEVCIKEIEKGHYVHLQTKDKDVCVAGVFENI